MSKKMSRKSTNGTQVNPTTASIADNQDPQSMDHTITIKQEPGILEKFLIWCRYCGKSFQSDDNNEITKHDIHQRKC